MKIIYSKNKLPANNELHVRIFSLMYQCLYSICRFYENYATKTHWIHTFFSV